MEAKPLHVASRNQNYLLRGGELMRGWQWIDFIKNKTMNLAFPSLRLSRIPKLMIAIFYSAGSDLMSFDEENDVTILLKYA
jgi:hypothetical protein